MSISRWQFALFIPVIGAYCGDVWRVSLHALAPRQNTPSVCLVNI